MPPHIHRLHPLDRLRADDDLDSGDIRPHDDGLGLGDTLRLSRALRSYPLGLRFPVTVRVLLAPLPAALDVHGEEARLTEGFL